MSGCEMRKAILLLLVGACAAFPLVGCGTSSLRTGEVSQTFVAPLHEKGVVKVSRAAEHTGEPLKSGDGFASSLDGLF